MDGSLISLTGVGELLRGFRSMEEKKKNYLDNLSDLSLWILSPIEVTNKKMIYSNMTKFQRVDIWDLSDVSTHHLLSISFLSFLMRLLQPVKTVL